MKNYIRIVSAILFSGLVLVVFQNCGSLESSSNESQAANLREMSFTFQRDNGEKVQQDLLVEERDGLLVLGGDMVMSDLDVNGDDNDFSTSLVQYNGLKWPDGKVPFYIDKKTVSETHAASIRGQVDRFNSIMEKNEIAVEFIEDPGGVNKYALWFIEYKAPEGVCGQATLGYRKNQSTGIWLSPNCITERTIHHEMLHTLGVSHEHQRPDRDRYIDVDPSQASTNMQIWYQIFENPQQAKTYGAYDINSIMHYYVGSAIIKHKAGGPVQTNRTKLSSGDISGLKRMYPIGSSASKLPTRNLASSPEDGSLSGIDGQYALNNDGVVLQRKDDSKACKSSSPNGVKRVSDDSGHKVNFDKLRAKWDGIERC